MGAIFNPFTGTIDFTGSSGGSTTPAAPNQSVQFNNSGSFGGDGGLLWDTPSQTLFVGDTVNVPHISVGNESTITADASTPGIQFEADGASTDFTFINTRSTTAPCAVTASNSDSSVYMSINANLDTGVATLSSSGAIYLHTANPATDDVIAEASVQLQNGFGLHSDKTSGHTALLQAYDVDGAAYSTFATLTNGNTPDFTIMPPSGGTVSLTGTTMNFVSYLETAEVSAPSAPAANGLRLFAQDNGSGKTQLMVLFATGAAQQIAVQA